MSRFEMTEEKMCAITGLSRDRMKKLRENSLTNGIHYQKGRSGIVYTEEGIEIVNETLRIRAEELIRQAEAQKNTPTPVQEDRHEENLRVWVLCPNPTWVKALRATGDMVQCRVKNNRTMHRGTILLKCQKNADGNWICKGRC